jgi:hypothetical protein
MKLMNKLFLLVLVFVGLTFSSARAGEVLINPETGQIRVESNPWRPVDTFEMEAFKNPGTEVPVWCLPQLQITNFFYGRIVRSATNVLVFKEGRIRSLPMKMTGGSGVIILWYKFLLVSAVLAMIVSNILFKRGNTASASAFAAAAVASAVASAVAVAVAVASASAVTVAAAAASAFAFGAAVAVAAASAFAFGAADDRLKYWILSGIFYVMAGLAIFV